MYLSKLQSRTEMPTLMSMNTLINSLENACRLLSAFKDSQPVGSDLHLVADDTIEDLYVTLDALALRLPPAKPAPDLSAG